MDSVCRKRRWKNCIGWASRNFMVRKKNHGSTKLSRRKFVLTGGAAAAGFTIVPRHVLGGAGFVAPSEKITLAYIGCGTQGLREMPALLGMPEIQVVAVCDPVKESHDYVDWSRDGLRS